MSLLIPSNKTELDKLIAYASDTSGEIKLDKRLQEIFDRVDYADNLIRRHKVDKVIVPMITTKWGCSEGSARRYMRLAKQIHGSNHKAEKNYRRHFYIEWLKETMAKAEANGDYKAFASIAKVVLQLEQFDKVEDEDDNLLTKPTQIMIGNWPEVEGFNKVDSEEIIKLAERLAERKKREKTNEDLFDYAEVLDGDN